MRHMRCCDACKTHARLDVEEIFWMGEEWTQESASWTSTGGAWGRGERERERERFDREMSCS